MKSFLHVLGASLLATLSVSSFAQSLTDSLKAHFEFDGNLLDSSGNEEHLELISGTISYEEVMMGDSAVYFDGESAISSIAAFDNSSYDEISVALWLKTETITSS